MKIREKLYWLSFGVVIGDFVHAIAAGDNIKCALLGAVVTLAVFVEFVKWAAPRSVR
jgi:choline-glycine betaine transporter